MANFPYGNFDALQRSITTLSQEVNAFCANAGIVPTSNVALQAAINEFATAVTAVGLVCSGS